jgi:hypothetical protein
MLGDSPRLFVRTSGVKHGNVPREFSDELPVDLAPPDGGDAPSPLSLLGVGMAFFLGPFEGLFFHQNALAFVPLSSSRPLNDNRFQSGVLAGTARQAGVATRQEDQVVEIGAFEALSLDVDLADPGALSEILITVVTMGAAACDEDDDLGGIGVLRFARHIPPLVKSHSILPSAGPGSPPPTSVEVCTCLAGFSDSFIGEIDRRAGCITTLTFERRLVATEGFEDLGVETGYQIRSRSPEVAERPISRGTDQDNFATPMQQRGTWHPSGNGCGNGP